MCGTMKIFRKHDILLIHEIHQPQSLTYDFTYLKRRISLDISLLMNEKCPNRTSFVIIQPGNTTDFFVDYSLI